MEHNSLIKNVNLSKKKSKNVLNKVFFFIFLFVWVEYIFYYKAKIMPTQTNDYRCYCNGTIMGLYADGFGMIANGFYFTSVILQTIYSYFCIIN